MKKLTLERVVPMIAARVSWLILGIKTSGLPSLLHRKRRQHSSRRGPPISGQAIRTSLNTPGGEAASVAMRRRLLDIFTLWLHSFDDGPAISLQEARSLSHFLAVAARLYVVEYELSVNFSFLGSP
jgi:hypothetical protein